MVVDVFKQCTLVQSDKWLDSVLLNPRLVEGKKQYFRVFRLPVTKESEAKLHFPLISLILHELDIATLYSQSVLQLVLNSLKKVRGVKINKGCKSENHLYYFT